MTPTEAVAYVWARLERYRYRPELITAREALRIVPVEVDPEAFRLAWDARGSAELRAQRLKIAGEAALWVVGLWLLASAFVGMA